MPRRSIPDAPPPSQIADDEPSHSFLLSVPNFFAWSPTSRVDEKIISTKSSTRAPALWDKHLHEKLILKKVVSAPDLTSRLGKTADSALEEARANPSHSKPDQLSEKIKLLGAACIKNTKCETEVQDFYKELIAPPCLAAAGALGFGTAGDFLKWQFQVYKQTKAKADGFLVVGNHGSDFLALPDKLKSHIKLLEEWNLNVLAIWEFKSLAAGSKKIMGEILGLISQESFPWTGCTSRSPCKSKRYHRIDPVPLSTGRKTSPDSSLPLIEFQPKVAKRSKARTKGPQVKAKHIIQQAWAEAVQNDTTFIVINAGLYEVIGFRHRASQTLYLSDIIKVSNSAPAYGKLHTGLYLAAFEDALDRAQQLNDMLVSEPRLKYHYYRHDYHHDKTKYNHGDPRDMNFQIRQKRLRVAQQEADFFTTLCERLKCCRKVEVKATIPIFGVAKVQHFNRYNTGEPVDSEPDVPNNLQLMLKPLSGRVYKCEVTLNRKTIAGRFVMKLAQGRECIQMLLREYEMYVELKEEGFKGIVEVYGLFWCARCPGMGLLMSHGGESLLHSKELKLSVRRLQIICQQFEDIVSALKRNRIYHRCLLFEHFVLNKFDGIHGPELSLSLISWGSAKWSTRGVRETDNGGAEIVRKFLGSFGRERK